MYRVLTALAVIIAMAGTAPASVTVELQVCQDAYICCCAPDVTNPNGGINYLYHGQYGSCYDRTLIQWDLSSLPPDIDLIAAEMRLYCEAFYGTESGYPVYYMISEAWSELDVTYNTQPGFDTSQEITGYWPDPDQWYTVDVTDYVEEWLSGTHDNYGIYCWCSETTGTCVPGFWSGDYPQADLRPVLRVTYENTSLETSTWGEVKTL